MGKYKYGDIEVGDMVECRSLEKGRGNYIVKKLSDEKDFGKMPSCNTVPINKGFLIDDGFMRGRGTFVNYKDVFDVTKANDFEEIEI